MLVSKEVKIKQVKPALRRNLLDIFRAHVTPTQLQCTYFPQYVFVL